ncbi:DNA-binding protein [Pseudomonas reidholzensis]|uniref:DNA-binding protein n=1 Tax=Pseudomonas reidholzensis TaxID=1785162 RepID=UPI000E5B3CC2|nr:DNA-binding protein [Pseudomonas reidholzensis]
MHASPVTEQACDTARQRLEKQGISLKEFAIKHGLQPSTVYAVLLGQKKCFRGEAH